MPVKEVGVVVDGGEADRDKEARERAAVFVVEASLVWKVTRRERESV
jgi:hypothetical protein